MLDKPSSCSGCQLYDGQWGTKCGYVPQDGTGDNGVLIILEAAGEDEAACGKPVVGKAGQFMWRELAPMGIVREGFRIHNVLSCRPPDNKLIKMPYTEAAIEHCSPNLRRTVQEHVAHCQSVGKTPVIVALGKFSFRQLMGIGDNHPIMRADYGTYPHWLPQWGCWLLAAPHPSHIMQGKNNLIPVMQYVFSRALEIASEGLTLATHDYMLNPSPAEFGAFVDDYYATLATSADETFLSYDIETPYKSGKAEDEIAREDDDDYVILRCGYTFNRPDGSMVSCSVRWAPEFMADHERLFASSGFGVNWNGSTYDDVRIRAYMPLNLISLDAMLAWHVLNTSLPKGLGFVTPFYVKDTDMWKHLGTPPKGMNLSEAQRQEAYYNAKDSHMALLNWFGIRRDLIENGLWHVFDRHVVQLNKVLAYMSGQGVLLDKAARQEAEDKLVGMLAEINERMQLAVPVEARRLKVFKKEPKDVTGLVRTAGERRASRCPSCGELDVRANHFKPTGKKALSAGVPENLCRDSKAEKVHIPALLWAEPLDWRISKLGLTAYQRVRNHQPFKDRKTKQVTFDVKAMKSLMIKYPDDPLYPVVLQYRKIQKLASTYIGITQYKEVEVDDSYTLAPGEREADNPPALPEGWLDTEQGREDQMHLHAQSIDTSVGESGTKSSESPEAS